MSGRRQIKRFLVVGVTTVALDLLVYRSLLLLGAPVAPAKTVGFIVGAVFAYFVNRNWTFQSSGGPWARLRFATLYLFSLACNVSVNAAALAVLPPHEAGRLIAFTLATGLSAALNFAGMKWLVFTMPAPDPVR